MNHLKPASSRGQAGFSGVDSRHTFSFGGYQDADNVRVSILRVINDDRVAPQAGFPTHGHRDMEIISYVLEGTLAHRDSLGNAGEVHAGEMQVMSAGTGITHSEFNASRTEPLRFLQIWIEPDARGHAPAWQQLAVSEAPATDGLRALVGPHGDPASMHIHADARILLAEPSGGDLQLEASAGRLRYIHVTRGVLTAGEARLTAGDSLLADAAEGPLVLRGDSAQALVFDLPDGPVQLR